MGIITFFKNIKYLSKYNLKEINKKVVKMNPDSIFAVVNSMLDNQIYEDPDNAYNLKKPKIYNFEETLDKLCSSDDSLIRFGDGETLLINGGEIGFQKTDTALAEHLKEIIRCKNDNIMIGINYHYYYADLRQFHDYPKFVYRSYIGPIRSTLNSIIDYNKQYCSAGITSAYECFAQWKFDEWYIKWKSIWNNKKITIICGDRVFNNIQYNIFDNASDIQYIYIPSVNAFDDYKTILEKAKKIDNTRIIIIIAGPTAKPLAYDLVVNGGYRCLDVGHLAKDYDAYKRHMPTDAVSIGKFFEPD